VETFFTTAQQGQISSISGKFSILSFKFEAISDSKIFLFLLFSFFGFFVLNKNMIIL
jgi:hypothetical protein